MEARTITKFPVNNEVIKKALADMEKVMINFNKSIESIFNKLYAEMEKLPEDSPYVEIIDNITTDIVNEIPDTIDFMNQLYSYCDMEESEEDEEESEQEEEEEDD